MEKEKKRLFFCVFFAAAAIAAAAAVSGHLDGGSFRVQKEAADEILRFHIRADSDEKEAQDLKIKVKNKILPYLQSILSGCRSKKECMAVLADRMDSVEKVSKKACETYGCRADVKVRLTKESFPLKQYGDMVLPSGRYDALRVDIGKGQGKNWWCMMYPSLCLVDGAVVEVPKESKEELEDRLGKEAYQSLFLKRQAEPGEPVYRIKWKIKELIGL